MASEPLALSEAEFCSAICEYFEIDGSHGRDSSLSDDLGLDSIAIFELLMFCEDIAGHPLAMEAEGSFWTLGAVYDFYAQMRQG